MSAKNINTLLDLWAATLLKHHDSPPFANHSDLYETIDSTPLGSVLWQSFSLTYNSNSKKFVVLSYIFQYLINKV